MKKIGAFIGLFILTSAMAIAQKYAFVDSEYIRKNIPAFTTAQEQLDKLSKQWEKEVADGYAVVEQLYKSYQNESVLLSQDMKTKREEAIIAKEKEMKDLQNKYFGVSGDLFKKREELVKPIQDDILKAMNRTGSKAEILVLIAKLRRTMPDLVLRTSYIAGFPGETPEDAEALKQFILETKFDHVGVFTYSAEDGTTAVVMANQVEEAEKQRRRNLLMEVQQSVVEEKLQRWVGKEIEVLLEKEVSDGCWLGRFRGQAPDIDGLVIYQGSGTVGTFVQAKATGTQGYDLLAEAIKGDA